MKKSLIMLGFMSLLWLTGLGFAQVETNITTVQPFVGSISGNTENSVIQLNQSDDGGATDDSSDSTDTQEKGKTRPGRGLLN